MSELPDTLHTCRPAHLDSRSWAHATPTDHNSVCGDIIPSSRRIRRLGRGSTAIFRHLSAVRANALCPRSTSPGSLIGVAGTPPYPRRLRSLRDSLSGWCSGHSLLARATKPVLSALVPDRPAAGARMRHCSLPLPARPPASMPGLRVAFASCAAPTSVTVPAVTASVGALLGSTMFGDCCPLEGAVAIMATDSTRPSPGACHVQPTPA